MFGGKMLDNMMQIQYNVYELKIYIIGGKL